MLQLLIVDATRLERNLNLVYQILSLTDNVIVCVNLLDEAKSKGISINLELLSQELGVPVVGTIAKKKKTLINLQKTIYNVCSGKIICSPNRVDLTDNQDENIKLIFDHAHSISEKVINFKDINYNSRDKKIDKILTSNYMVFL